MQLRDYKLARYLVTRGVLRFPIFYTPPPAPGAARARPLTRGRRFSGCNTRGILSLYNLTLDPMERRARFMQIALRDYVEYAESEITGLARETENQYSPETRRFSSSSVHRSPSRNFVRSRSFGLNIPFKTCFDTLKPVFRPLQILSNLLALLKDLIQMAFLKIFRPFKCAKCSVSVSIKSTLLL